jgi:precorrin-2 dehydrogenase / sirohydrochlorin ferrochelatase
LKMSSTPPLLIALELKGRRVAVFGQSAEAARRASALLEHGAEVTLIAPERTEVIQELASREPRLTLYIREPNPDDLVGQWLVVVADQNPQWVSRLGPAAEAARVLFCAVDQPGWNTFSHVGVARAGALQLGVSTEGRAPGLSAVLRRELQKLLDESRFEEIVDHVVQLRENASPEERSERVRDFVRGIYIEGSIRTPHGLIPPTKS